MLPKYCNSVKLLVTYFKELEKQHTIDYCGISGLDDFSNYENIVTFKYKYVNSKQQFSKVCDFLSINPSLDYDWYIKLRPDLRLLDTIDFNKLSECGINARARVYTGPKQIKYGCSVNGEGRWKSIGDCFYDPVEKQVILDDMFYIFHKKVIEKGAFEPVINDERENEWLHSRVWKSRNIEMNVIGFFMENVKYNTFSGDLNMNMVTQ
jgi:hypothetical protein